MADLAQQTDVVLELGLIEEHVNKILGEFLDARLQGPNGSAVALPVRILWQFLNGGGKKLRPSFLWCGWAAAEGVGSGEAVYRAGAGLELFHAFALIQDDVFDGADTRRGHPTAHRAFAGSSGGPRAGRDAESAAILLGNLCAAWSAEILDTVCVGADAASAERFRGLLNAMRSEMLIGQYLDLCVGNDWYGSVEATFEVAHYKTTKYTVERPLHLGAALAAAGEDVLSELSAFARPLGEAFQLFDDLEDVTIAPGATGPAGTDLREGRRSILLAMACDMATPLQRARLRALIGDPRLDDEQLAEACALVHSTGAPERVRHLMRERQQDAMRILEASSLAKKAKDVMRYMVDRTLGPI